MRSLWLAAVLVFVPSVAHAQASNRLAPVGGRTTLVGGTGVIFGHDSASTFLNPATAVRVDKNRLSFSVDFYFLSLTRAPSWYQPGPIDRSRYGDVKSDGAQAISAFDFDSLPGSLCLFFGIADLPFLARAATKELREKQARLGLCLASISYTSFTFNAEGYEQRTASGVTRQAHNVRQTFRRLAVGPTYSMWIDNRVAIGASVHASRASHRSMLAANATTYRSAGGPVESSFYNFSRGDSHDLTATIGMTYRISPRQTVGVAVESPSLHLFGSGGFNQLTQVRGGGDETSSATASGSFVARTPARVSIGTGVEDDWGSAELNASYSTGLTNVYVAEFEGRQIDVGANGIPVDVEKRTTFGARSLGTVNLGAGAELYTSPRLSLLGGASIDVSVVPKGTLPADELHYYPARMHRTALSFGVGSHGGGGDLLVGTEVSYGWGERLAPNVYQTPPRLAATEQQVLGFLVVLAGSTSFKTFQRAVDDVKKAIVPEPKK
jgi:hypothetical protein